MKEHIWDRAAVLKGVQSLCNWTAIPAGVLNGMSSGLPPSHSDPDGPSSDADDQLQRLCVHLADCVPLEWRVEAGGDQQLTQPALNAQAVSTPGGVFCLGGRRTEGAKQVAVQHEESWMTTKMGLEDCSQVIQVRWQARTRHAVLSLLPAPRPVPTPAALGRRRWRRRRRRPSQARR